jgi:parallel beta-helix repeat protein
LRSDNNTVVGNRAIGNVAGGIIAGENINTTIAKNDVIGNPDTNADGIFVAGNSRNTTVLKNDVRSIPEGHNAIEVDENSINTAVAGNDLIGDTFGVLVEKATGTKILSNDVSRSGESGITIFGPERANNDAKVVGNRISAVGTLSPSSTRRSVCSTTRSTNPSKRSSSTPSLRREHLGGHQLEDVNGIVAVD